MDLDAASLIGAALAVALAAIVQLAAGFGFGLTAVPLLSIAVGAHDAVVVALFLATFTNAFQAWTGRRETDRPVAARLLAGAAVGLPIGFLVYQLVDDRVLRVRHRLLGHRGRRRHRARPRPAPRRARARCRRRRADRRGSTMSSGVNGPPLVFVLQARHFDQHRFRATVTTVFVVLDIVAVVTFAVTGDLDADVLAVVAASLPGLALGALVGIAVRRHLDPRRFRALVLVLLVVAGVSTLVSAVRA